MNIKEVEVLKEKIESAEKESLQLEGELKSLTSQLKKYGVSTIEELSELIEKKQKEVSKLEAEIQRELAELEEAYEG